MSVADVRWSHYSALQVPAGTRARLLFPGRDALTDDTLGYVRSAHRAGIDASAGERSLPWRDYPDGLRTHEDDLLPRPFDGHQLVVTARNVLNEYGYQARIGGRWYRRCDDPPIDPTWPVLRFGARGLELSPLSEAESRDGDLLSGVPLVRNGRAASRPELIAACSDVAHSYEVHPRGKIGPSRAVWRELSDAWHRAKRSGASDAELAQRLEQLAGARGARTSRNLLHSAIASRYDGELVLLAATGSLEAIAGVLVGAWKARDAVLLDNGGSTAWRYCPNGASRSQLVVAGPNHRPSGTAFIVLPLNGFPQPLQHPALPANP